MTLEEILRAAGQTDEQIKAILGTLGPAKGVFETTLAEADRKNQEALRLKTESEAREKKLNEFWTNEATPQINQAYSEKASAEARAAFFQTQAEQAKKAGFIAADAPGFTPNPNPANPNPANPNPAARNANGEFVANTNPVPGSPAYLTPDQGFRAITTAAFLMTEHQRLFGEPLPDLEALMNEAVQSRSNAKEVWARKYNVEAKRKEIAEAATKAERDKIRAEVDKEVRTEYANKYGNENTRPMVPSRFPNYAKDEKTGAPDKLAWTKDDRRERLRSRIHDQVSKESGRVQ